MDIQKNNLDDELDALFHHMHVSLFGVGGIHRFSILPKEKRPDSLLPGARSVIAAALPVIPSAHDWSIRNQVKGGTGIAFYQGMIDLVGSELDRCLYEVARFLLDEGYRVIWQPTFPKVKKADMESPHEPWKEQAPISQVLAGYFCGLGSIGMNHLLLTQKYGPRIRINSLITDAELTESPMSEELCTRCGRCLRACPVHAFRINKSLENLAKTNYNKEACWKSRVLYRSNRQCDCGGRCIISCPVGEVAIPESASDRYLRRPVQKIKEKITQ